MSKIILTKKYNAIFLAIVLVVGVFAISSPLTVYGQQYEQDYESAYYPSHPGMAEDNQLVKIQKANCDNDNVNVNDLSQVQRQEQTLRSGGFNPDAGDAALSGQDLTPDEAFAAINGNGDPLITAERNILNVCFNDNDNELSGDFTGTQTQTPPTPPPTPPPTSESATLTVIKQVTNDDEGTAQASDFTLRLHIINCDGTLRGAIEFQGSEQGVTFQLNPEVDCGYRVLEVVPAGYTLTTDCRRELGDGITAGAQYTCIHINDDNPT